MSPNGPGQGKEARHCVSQESPVFIGMARMPMACLATRKELWLFLGRMGGFNRVGMFCGGVVGG